VRWTLAAFALVGCSEPGTSAPMFGGATGAEPISSLSAAISWELTDDDEARYAIYASETPGGQIFDEPATLTERGATGGPLTGLEPGRTYYVVVRARDAEGNEDDNTVEVTASSGEPVSLAGDVQTIYDRRCAYGGCHANDLPAEGLDLSAGASHGATVGVEAVQCAPARLLVAPGQPEASYMIDKIIERDMCAGVRMPRTGNVNSVDIQILSDWITEGALDN
jgi:hypothetical protein